MRSNVTGVGFYNSEPRNFNRGFGRGTPKQFQPSQTQSHPSTPPPRKGDLFVEAGRLAVEYLVSRGLLSSNVLSGKYQNGTLKNNVGESQELRSLQDKGGSKRSSIDQDLTMSRNHSKERRRLGPSRSFSSDRSRENDKEVSLADEAIPSRAMEVDNDTVKDTAKVTDTSVQNSHPAEPANVIVITSDDLDLKMTSLVQDKDDNEIVNSSDVVTTVFEEIKNGSDNHEKEQDSIMSNLAILQGEEKSNASPLMNRNQKSDSLLISKENNTSVTGHDSLDSETSHTINGSEEIPSSECLATSVLDHSFREAGVVNPVYTADLQKTMESLPFADKTFSYEQESSELPELGMCSTVKDRGEKRPVEEDIMMEGAKRAKQQWLSVAPSDEYSQLSDLSENHSISPAKGIISMFNISASQESFTNMSLPLKADDEPHINQGEKQLLSSSFKICDLNLMEASDMHENHEVPAMLYPTISAISGSSRKLPVDIDLTMRNSCNLTNEYNDSGPVRKDIEIIDLESTSLEECKSPNTSTKNIEAGATSMESFPNPQNTTDNPDGHDGYGFMISELLGNDIPNCSSVQPDMNSLHNDVGINHGEGMFSEDDPIYMSLGEIPLTGLLRAWEQPTQERNPFEL